MTNHSPRRRSHATLAIGFCTIAILATLIVGSAHAVTPPTVLLGTAGQYAVLAGSGITNTGPTTISGDVGSSPTSSETGFAACPAADCVTLTGANHVDPNPNDATTVGAKSALTTAYDDAAGRSPTTVLTELAGQTLVAGVYSSASGTFGMTGTLVLDGENNTDAVFIFQTGSTLITGGTGNVSLIRGAQACNIFWKIGSAATLGAGSTFRGTILAHDTISLGDGVTVEGRLLAGEQASGTGAVTLIHDTITKPSTCVKQSDVDAAAAAATAAANQAAADQAAADKAAADQAAADQAAAVAKAEAEAVAAAKAIEAANAEAAKVAAAKVEAANAAASARAARVKAAAARSARATAAASAKAAAAKAAAVKKRAAAKSAKASKQHGHARLARGPVAFTG
jgi:Ice-binding-like